MDTSPTTGDLFKAKAITDDEVNAAVEVFMRDPPVSPFRFAGGHTPDPAAAVKAHEPDRPPLKWSALKYGFEPTEDGTDGPTNGDRRAHRAA